jgi:hypothetical protein
LRVGSSSTKVSHRYEDIYLSTLRYSQPTSQSLLPQLKSRFVSRVIQGGKGSEVGSSGLFFFILLSKIKLRVHE